MPNAIFFIALPGAGKTTYIKNQKEKYSGYEKYVTISADVLKESHPDYNPEKSFELHEWSVKEAEKSANDIIKKGIDFIFDGGGINDKYSLRIMTATKEAGYDIALIHINTPLYECLKRLKSRERKVPIEDMFYKAMKLKSCLSLQKKLCDIFIEVPFYTNKNLIFDMDGTIVEYVAHPLKCEFAPANIKMDYINNNVFEYAEPVIPVVEKIYNYKNRSEIFILSVSANSETNKQKLKWLEKNLPFVKPENIYFVGTSEKKIDVLKQLLEKLKIKSQDLTYIDDLHSMVWEALNAGINAIHPSEFLTSKY